MVEVQEYIHRLNEGVVDSPEFQKFRRLRPGKFYQLCKLRLSFLIDVPCEFLHAEHPIDNATAITKNFFSGSNKAQAKLMDESGICDRIIDNLMKLIHHLEQESCIEMEGIFRKSGNLSRQRELKDLILRDHDLANILHPNSEKSASYQYNVHDVAGVLKSLLTDLMQPLLTAEFLDYFIQAANLCPMSRSTIERDSTHLIRKGKQINSIRLLMLLLPKQNRNVLRQLLVLLHKVSLHQDKNRMTSESLGTLFGPLLLTKKKITSKELKNNFPILNQLATYMIELEESLFLIPQTLADEVANCIRKRQQRETQSPSLTPNMKFPIYHSSIGFQRAKSETSLHTFHKDSGPDDDANSDTYDSESDPEELETCVNFTQQRIPTSANTKTTASDSSCKSLSVDDILMDSPSTDHPTNHDATKYAVAELYAQVQALPESHDKRKWIQKFNQHNGGGITPCRYLKKIKHASNSDLRQNTFWDRESQEQMSWMTESPKSSGTFNRHGTSHGIRSSLRKRLALRSHVQIAPLSFQTKCPLKSTNPFCESNLNQISPSSYSKHPISPNSNSTDSTSSYTSSTSEIKAPPCSSSGEMIKFLDLVKMQCPDEKEEFDLSPDNKSSNCSPFKNGWKSRLNLLSSSPILTGVKTAANSSSLKREKIASQSKLLDSGCITSPQGVDYCDSATCSLTPKTRKLESPFTIKSKFSRFRKKPAANYILYPLKS